MIIERRKCSFYKKEKRITIVRDALHEVIYQEHAKTKKLLKSKGWYLRQPYKSIGNNALDY